MIRTAIIDGRHRTVDTDAIELGERVHTWLLTEQAAPISTRILALRIAAGWRPVGAPVLAVGSDGRRCIRFITSGRRKASPDITEEGS
jgi:hypothetical protein